MQEKNIIPNSCFIYFPYKISIIKPKKSFTVGTCIYTKFVCIYTSTLPQRFYLKQIIVTKYVYFLIVNLLQNRLQRIMTMRFGLPSYPSRACVLFTMESGRFFRGRRWVLCDTRYVRGCSGKTGISSREDSPGSLTVFMLSFETGYFLRGRKLSGQYTCISDLYYLASE